MKNLTLFIFLLFVIFSSSPSTESSRPNIIFIMADDMGYSDAGCYGQEVIQTPHIDRLASEGLRFTQVYSGASVCAPARSVLMTGLHTGHTRVRITRKSLQWLNSYLRRHTHHQEVLSGVTGWIVFLTSRSLR